MKKITTPIILGMVLSFGQLCWAGPTKDPVAYWSFNNPLDLGYDDSGHGNDATLTDTSWIPGGKVGGALEFNGTTSKGEVSDSAWFDTITANKGLTIDVLFKIDSLPDHTR
ncbi:unnamed protein product [marine sediment metagenome]|uniref:Uncharacterized protein n=1 Tax=marine sediment metagenome TaxID=412755 RepID=X0S268_9ZZZZ